MELSTTSGVYKIYMLCKLFENRPFNSLIYITK